jgi:hypothetical protein
MPNFSQEEVLSLLLNLAALTKYENFFHKLKVGLMIVEEKSNAIHNSSLDFQICKEPQKYRSWAFTHKYRSWAFKFVRNGTNL